MKASLLAIILACPPMLVVGAHSQLSLRAWHAEEIALGWRDSVRQTLHYSCGPALLASSAQAAGATISEFELIHKANIDEAGITLAEFRRLASGIGWHGNWYVGLYSNLLSTELPVAVHISVPVHHFVLIHFLTDSHVLIEDPASGFRNVNRRLFEKWWSGYFYALDF